MKMSAPLQKILQSPSCWLVERRPMQTCTIYVLATVQMLVGLVNLGLEPGRLYASPEGLSYLGNSYRLGVVFFVTGAVTLFSDSLPALYFTVFAVLINVISSVFSIIGVVETAVDLAAPPASWMCDQYFTEFDDKNCIIVACVYQSLLTGVNVTLLFLNVLQMCVSISFAVLGLKAVVNGAAEEDEDEQSQLKEILLDSPGHQNKFITHCTV